MQLAAEYMAKQQAQGRTSEVSWAVGALGRTHMNGFWNCLATQNNAHFAGGRNEEKLRQVRAKCQAMCKQSVGVVTADSMDRESIARNIVGQARAVLSFAGPYEQFGTNLVDECARQGTDYADLTGELTFLKRSVDELHPIAKESGAMLVHRCALRLLLVVL